MENEMPINRRLAELQTEIDAEGKKPDVLKIRKEHQLLAERNKNLILGFSKQIKRLLATLFIALGILILITSYYNDKASCERQGQVRTSLIALRNGFIYDAIAREKSAQLSPGTAKAEISLTLARQLRAEAAEVGVHQLKCGGIPQVK
jgi:hypothetical protein